ncbi:MAG: methionyl-tRNA formyltransferase [Flavobacteriales bacterium]|nr:methionyl-tRNA formyltransferase [Flavobacteriales bacterium]
MDRPRIVFMGTPAFAVASLEALVNAGIDIAAVVTAPDRPAGRGQQLRMSAVKQYALTQERLKDRILQPEKLKDPRFLEQLDAFDAALYVVVAFRMLPESVWAKPSMGTINLHASLLPDYRGAAPINWAVMNGESRTGATTFFIRHEIDTGDVIMSEVIDIGTDETAGELHDRLMVMGAALLTRTVQRILAGDAPRTEQVIPDPSRLHHAPKLNPDNCHLDAHRSAREVHDHVRGLSPFPGAWATWTSADGRSMHFKILRTAIADAAVVGEAGRILVEQDQLLLQCATGRVRLLEVQPEGKKRMTAAEFIRGSRALEGVRLS